MSGWADNIFGNLPGPPLKGSPKRPKMPDNTPLMPVDPRQVIGGLMDQGAQGVGHAIDYATGQPVGEGFSQPTLGREAYQMLTSPTFGGGMSPMAGASTLAAVPLAARAARAGRTAEEIATGARAATDADAAAQASRAAQASPGQAALDQMTQGQPRTMAQVPDIRTMPVQQGVQAAQSQPHLIPGGGSSPGYYIGGPASIQSPADLAAMRQSLDQRIAQGQAGADWYDRERHGLARTTGNDQPFNDFLSKMHGSWSQGVDPQSETAFVTKEAMSAASGQPERAMYQNQHDAFLNALDANNPNLMQTGKKTDEYAQHLNPLQPSFAPTATGVNDFRMGQEMGFTNADAEERAGEFSLGETQHKFMDYETALATQRANAANLGGRSNWTGEQIQASPWTIQKAGALQGMRKSLSDEDAFAEANKTPSDFDEKHAVSATYEQQPAAMLAATGHTPQAGAMTPQQRIDYANDPGARWASAPSFGLETGELPRDVIYGQGRIGNSGMGLPTLPTMSGTGYFKNAAGDLENNPMFVARPLTPFHAAGSLTGDIGATIKQAKNAAGDPATGPFSLLHGDDQIIPLGQQTGAKDIANRIAKAAPDPSKPLTLTSGLTKDLGTWEGYDPVANTTIAGTPAGNKVTPGYAQDLLNTGELARSYFGAQEGGAWHKNWAQPTTGGTTGYFTPLGRPATPEEMTGLADAGKPSGMGDVTSSAKGVTRDLVRR